MKWTVTKERQEIGKVYRKGKCQCHPKCTIWCVIFFLLFYMMNTFLLTDSLPLNGKSRKVPTISQGVALTTFNGGTMRWFLILVGQRGIKKVIMRINHGIFILILLNFIYVLQLKYQSIYFTTLFFLQWHNNISWWSTIKKVHKNFQCSGGGQWGEDFYF